MRAQSRRIAFALDAIAAALEALATVPDGDDKLRLVAEARACERKVQAWRDSPPAIEEREAVMKKVLSLHVAVARLRRAAEQPAAAPGATGTPSDRPTAIPPSDATAPPAPPPAARAAREASAERMQQLLRDGALEESLAHASALLAVAPLHRKAREVAKKASELLEEHYSRRLAPLSRVPELGAKHRELAGFQLDRAEMSIVALVGRGATVEAILSACGLPRLQALRTLSNLVDRGIITLD